MNFSKFGEEAVSLRLLYKAQSFLGKGPYDIIHCHFGPNGNQAVLLKQAGAIEGKLAVAFHGYDLTSYLHSHGNQVYAGLFKHADLFLPISNRWKEKIVDLGCPPEKIFIHRMGIDVRKYGIAPIRGAGRRSWD